MEDIFSKTFGDIYTFPSMEPSDVINTNYSFGTIEMGKAAKEIVTKCISNSNSWFTLLKYDNIENKNGFLQLLCNGWMQSSPYPDSFLITANFVECLNKSLNKSGLNLGCGSRPISNYQNIDFLNIDIDPKYKNDADKIDAKFQIHDLTKKLPFTDNSFFFINISQCLEHFNLYDAIKILYDCKRVLLPNGTIRVSVPDAGLLLSKLLEKDMDHFSESQPRTFKDIKSQMTKFGLILFGALHEHGEYGHCQCYDMEGLMEIMQLTGFQQIQSVTYDNIFDAEIAENHQLALVGSKSLS